MEGTDLVDLLTVGETGHRAPPRAHLEKRFIAIYEPLMHRLSLQLYLWVLSGLSGTIRPAISWISTNGQGAAEEDVGRNGRYRVLRGCLFTILGNSTWTG
jgi:hypothetical protein